MADAATVSSAPEISPCANDSFLHTKYTIRTQSSRLHDDTSIVCVAELKTLLERDVQDRMKEVGDGIAADLFSDEAFGFPINDQFVKNFCGSIISTGQAF